MDPTDPRYGRIARYAERRMRRRGDLYGWSPMPRADGDAVVFLVPLTARAESFPARIAGIEIVVRPIPPVEAQCH